MDYKSGQKKLDRILVEHGVQLQLLAYLAAVRHWPDPRALFGVQPLIPAGVFYVNLRGQYESGGTRDEALADAAAARKRAYRHAGRFDAGALSRLDRTGAADQFNYRLTRMAPCGQIQWRRCRGRNLKRCSTALRRSCKKWGGRFFPARRRWIPIAKAMKRRASFVIIAPCAGLIRGRTSIACYIRQRNKLSIIQAWHKADQAPRRRFAQPRLCRRPSSTTAATSSLALFACWDKL